jgi:hypothetical protein
MNLNDGNVMMDVGCPGFAIALELEVSYLYAMAWCAMER